MRFDNDELRYRFTAWMKIVVIRKKLEYIRKLKRHRNEVSFKDGILHDKIISDPFDIAETNLQEFDFCNESLASAYKNLPARYRQILGLIYLENAEPETIAQKFGITVQYVYNVCSLAIKRLKRSLIR